VTTALQDLEQALQQALSFNVVGLQSAIRALTIAVVARGHVLIQGAPGLGKTLLSKSLAAAIGGNFKRIQGTADLMPSDIIGVHVFDAGSGEFVFRPGPLFTDVLLFDEINRAGPKTQSALLEAMEERQVSVDRANFALPPGFLVIATQNPRDFEGTYPLPESQLDRFMLRVELDYPVRTTEAAVLERYGAVALSSGGEVSPISPVADEQRLAAARVCACRRAARWRCCGRRASKRACEARTSSALMTSRPCWEWWSRTAWCSPAKRFWKAPPRRHSCSASPSRSRCRVESAAECTAAGAAGGTDRRRRCVER